MRHTLLALAAIVLVYNQEIEVASSNSPGSHAWTSNIIQLFHEMDYISDINVSGPRRRTPLHLAVLRSDPPNTRTVLLLLELGADVNCSDESKQTPLHMATLSGQMDMVKLLLQHGANPLARKFKGHQPWVCAALVHKKDLMVFLKELTDAELGKAVNSQEFLGQSGYK
jgi:ankyrin repeat protein